MRCVWATPSPRPILCRKTRGELMTFVERALLDALTQCVEEIILSVNYTDGNSDTHAVVNQAETVIAQANGEN